IVREFSPIASNWRSDEDAAHYLASRSVPVAAEIDTRALVRHLRTRGVMRGVLAHDVRNHNELIERARETPSMAGLDLATRVSTPQSYQWAEPSETRFHVVAYDFGIKRNILRRLQLVGARVTVVPANTTAEDVLRLNPDGVFLSNGPGDPEPLLDG